MIKILELKPKSGLLTELQSDTIYGHFCWRLKEKYGSEKLTAFISAYKEGNAVFLLSDGLIKSQNKIHIPTPLTFEKPVLEQTKKDKIQGFVKRKNNKENKSISVEQLNVFLKSGVLADSSEEPDFLEMSHQSLMDEQLRVSVQIDRNTSTSMDGKLFSYSPKYLNKNLTFSIFIKILDEKLFDEFQCELILKEVFEIGFGKKKSSGYGSFEIIGLDNFSEIKEPAEGNAFLILGNYLPSPDDQCAPVGYNIITKYGKFGEVKSQSVNPFKNPIIFFTSGSCFKTNSTAKHYFGRITDPGEISEHHPETAQFGCPFFLRFNYKTE